MGTRTETKLASFIMYMKRYKSYRYRIGVEVQKAV